MKKNAKKLRTLVALAIVAVVTVGFVTNVGIGTMSAPGIWDISILCPLGALGTMLASKMMVPRAVISLIVMVLLIVLFARAFCGWICPVPLVQKLRGLFAKKRPVEHGEDAGAETASCHPERAKRVEGSRAAIAVAPSADAARDPSTPLRSAQDDKKVAPLTSEEEASLATPCASCASKRGAALDARHFVLGGALASTFIFGFPVFCLVCPIGLTFATVLLVMRLFAFGDATWTVVAFPVIIALEILLLPKWCQRFCPLGALLSLFSGLNRTFRPQVDAEKCLREGRGKACNLCEQACPEGINLHDIAAGETTLNDCSKCRACADVCPEHAITFPLLPKKQTQVAALPVDDEIPERG